MMRSLLALSVLCAAALPAQQPRVTVQTSGVRGTLEAVSAVSQQVAWASGSGGAVIRTRDGGETWELRTVPDAQALDFRGIVALSADEAWIMGAGTGTRSRILHTIDGGATWTEQSRATDSTAFYDCIAFFDSRHGVVFGDATAEGLFILRTEDGGAHWQKLAAPAIPAGLPSEGAFASSNGCFAPTDKSHAYLEAGTPSSRIFRTDDAGRTWTVVGSVPVIHGATSGLTAIAFRDAKHGIGVAGLVSGNMTRDTSAAVVATTEDGGNNWTLRHRTEQPGMFSGVAMVPAAGDKAVIAATYSGVYVSSDLGDHWTSVASGYYWAVRAVGKRAWAVGRGGIIARIDY